MTSKEKAEDLINKMNVIHYMKLRRRNKDSKGLPISMYDDQIKQCALIAVDEIIKELESTKFNYGVEKLPFHYWQEVKKEIELL